MYLPLYLENKDVIAAEALIAEHGGGADFEAANRAKASRDVGNHISFCRWRQIERLIVMLKLQTTLGTIH